MTDEERYEAGNLKYEPKGTAMLRQLSTGNFALYHLGGLGHVFWIGPAEGIAEAYTNRPPPPARHNTTPDPRPRTVAGINIDDLEIDL